MGFEVDVGSKYLDLVKVFRSSWTVLAPGSNHISSLTRGQFKCRVQEELSQYRRLKRLHEGRNREGICVGC